MKILTLEIDENSKKGKALIDFLVAFFSEEGDVQIIAIDGLPLKNSTELESSGVAESKAKYKVSRKQKKQGKKTEDPEAEKSPYNPEFVKMVLEAAKGETTRILDPNNIWGSLGLK